MEEEALEEKELSEAREKVRAKMRQMFAFASTSPVPDNTISEEDEYGPLPQSHKPYVPPTEMTDSERSPFGDVLDAPMGV